MKRKRAKKPNAFRALKRAYGDVLMKHRQLGTPIKIWKGKKMKEIMPDEIIAQMTPQQRKECGLADLKAYRPPPVDFL